MKRCSDCRETKHERDFYRNARAGDGLCNRCKACDNSRSKGYVSPSDLRAGRSGGKMELDAAYWTGHAERTLNRIGATRRERELVRKGAALIPLVLAKIDRKRSGGRHTPNIGPDDLTPDRLIEAFSERRRRAGRGELHWKRKIQLEQAMIDYHRAEYGTPMSRDHT